MSMDESEIHRRLAGFEPVRFDDVREELAAEPARKAFALRAVAISDLHAAMADLAELAKLEKYENERTNERIRALAVLIEGGIPAIEALKGMTLAAAHRGNLEQTVVTASELYGLAAIPMGRAVDDHARRSMRYVHDADIERAIERVSWIAHPIERTPSSTLRPRVFVLSSSMNDEDVPAIVCRAWARGLRERGWDVAVACTQPREWFAETQVLRSYLADGFELIFAPDAPYVKRIEALIAAFEAKPAHLAFFALSATDVIGKLFGDLGIARAQITHNFSFTPHVGRYDVILNDADPDQETLTRWPGKSRSIGRMIAAAPEIDRSKPFDFRTVNIPVGAVVLGTFGRSEKCCSPEYLQTLPELLLRAPEAYLVIAGPMNQAQAGSLSAAFNASRVVERVRVLGARPSQSAALVRGIDIYCDTMPFSDGQSLLDAMQAGKPIVAARRTLDTDLEPSGRGGTSSVAESVLEPHVELAAAGDSESYIRLALAYVRDPARRARDGELLGRVAREEMPYDGYMDKLDRLFRQTVAAKFGGAFAVSEMPT